MPKRRSPRALFGLAALCLAPIFAAAAAPPTATPTPKPVATPVGSPAASPIASPAASATASPTAPPAGIEQLPTVLIYPFDVQTGTDARIGAAIAQILAQEMTAAGGITVPPVPHGVKRADFLENAHSAHADFYISGYVTPVGDSAAVVEQVVSVGSGVILFSQTAQVSSVADVASQSLLARSQILAFLGRGTQSVDTQTSNTPAPTSTNGAQVPIKGLSNIVNSVFKHNKGPAHTPTPGPVVKPSRGVIVAPVTASGAVEPADVAGAQTSSSSRSTPISTCNRRRLRRAWRNRPMQSAVRTAITRSQPERCKSCRHATENNSSSHSRSIHVSAPRSISRRAKVRRSRLPSRLQSPRTYSPTPTTVKHRRNRAARAILPAGRC